MISKCTIGCPMVVAFLVVAPFAASVL